MTYTVVPDPKVETTLRKMWQKDSARFGQIEKKLREQSRKSGNRISPSKNRSGDSGACTPGTISLCIESIRKTRK
jgi:hypothetical protein